MSAATVCWRPPAVCAHWALAYYLEFFSQFPKIRFALDVNGCCDSFSLELAKLSERVLGIRPSIEGLEAAKKAAAEKGSGLSLDFQKESLKEVFERLKAKDDPQSVPDFVVACNAFWNEEDQKKGVKWVSPLASAFCLSLGFFQSRRGSVTFIG